MLYRAFDMNMATVGFIHYSDAKQRRDVLTPFFSRTSVRQMQDLIKERVGCSPAMRRTVYLLINLSGDRSLRCLGSSIYGR